MRGAAAQTPGQKYSQLPGPSLEQLLMKLAATAGALGADDSVLAAPIAAAGRTPLAGIARGNAREANFS